MANFKAVVRGERKDGFMQVYIQCYPSQSAWVYQDRQDDYEKGTLQVKGD